MKKINIRQGKYAIALVCAVLGFMLATQFHTTQDVKATLALQRTENLAARLQETEKERDSLLQQIRDLREKSGEEAMQVELQNAMRDAGLTRLRGPGITLTIDDSKRPAKPGENSNLFVVHDDDILRIINELWAAGAEAIAINDQRIVAQTEVRCAGPTLVVNGSRYAPPFEIRAIGDKKTLESAVKMRGGIADSLAVWGIEVNVTPSDNIEIPAFRGAWRFNHSQVVGEDSR
ncbi:MAG: DUF881 domain-containing protein [Negativicutes bacterium]|nr:DUF881 domain-containing protein [Negativicutes bacterium]